MLFSFVDEMLPQRYRAPAQKGRKPCIEIAWICRPDLYCIGIVRCGKVQHDITSFRIQERLSFALTKVSD